MLLIIFINIIVIYLGFVVSDLIDFKDTKTINNFFKLECKKCFIRGNINH